MKSDINDKNTPRHPEHNTQLNNNIQSRKGLLFLQLYVHAMILMGIAAALFILPALTLIYYLNDSALNSPKIPKAAIVLHKNLSKEYGRWAKNRITSLAATNLDQENISGTEWPLFGSVFYLLATENLQQAWQNGERFSDQPPAIYAADAIEQATKLVLDPGHAAWVRRHWGDDYLHRENVFYRMLLISAMTSYQNLTGNSQYESFLRDQVETFSAELDRSKFGLLDDYPYQCYPTDVVAAIAAIQRADAVLKTDHSQFVKRAIRGFEGTLVDSTGLPPYFANAHNGTIYEARGCSSQWILQWAPTMWPEAAARWYQKFDEHFWQADSWLAGFREFTRQTPKGDWYFDVDSGPVVYGLGAAASAFGMGAARMNGRFDHAQPLAAEILAFSWPLPNGRWLTPQLLSDHKNAPYLGEIAILFNLSRLPTNTNITCNAAHLPGIVYLIVAAMLAAGLLFFSTAVVRTRRIIKLTQNQKYRFAPVFFSIWLSFLIAAAVMLFIKPWLCAPLLLASLLIPVGRKIRPEPTNKITHTDNPTPPPQ